MSDERNEVERNAKLDMEESMDQDQMQNTVAADQFLSPILKFKVIGFEELFEYLSLADLLSLRQTCKRLKRVVDYFINTNYPAVKIGYGLIWLDSEQKFNELQQMDPINVTKIKDVTIHGISAITQNHIDVLKDVLPQLERLEIEHCEFGDIFCESILKSCTNLKYLSLWNTRFLNDGGRWKLRQYPTIEHIRIRGIRPEETEDWKTFFDLNTNIQILTTGMNDITEIRNILLGSNIKFDRLNFSVYIDLTINQLNELHEQGNYKRLHLTCLVNREENLDAMKLLRGLEKIDVLWREHLFVQPTLPSLPELKEMYFQNHFNSNGFSRNYDYVAKSIINVERVYFETATSDQIMSFIRYAPRVKEIKVEGLQEGTHFENGVINLSALNKERKGLAGANKITIYIDERAYLSTKMVIMKTEFSFVSLKRAEAIDWNNEWL